MNRGTFVDPDASWASHFLLIMVIGNRSGAACCLVLDLFSN
jgi:hypothetical protein